MNHIVPNGLSLFFSFFLFWAFLGLSIVQVDKSSDIFVTLTCNQREHFGTCVPKRYIDDGKALENYKLHRMNHFPSESL